MEFINAFLMATAWAYGGCLIFTLRGKPPMVNIDRDLQGWFYLLAWSIFVLGALDVFPHYVYAFLGVVYSFATICSFIGYPQIWMAYWTSDPKKGSAAGQIGMALWDLAIAVFCFMKVTL